MVGAVIIRDGQIIGAGYHKKAGTPHAEVHALNQAGTQARGATMYVSLEPCSHYGRTPPCAEAVINAGVARLVAAMPDPNPLVSGRGLRKLAEAGVEVFCGVLEQEARELNEVFIKFITTNLPFVVAKWAMTLDGKIASYERESRWITGDEARTFTHGLRDAYDAIMVGIGTVLADDPALTTRVAGGHDPIRVILDSRLRLPLEARVLGDGGSTLVATTAAVEPARVAQLQARGAEIIIAGEGSKVDFKLMLERLGERGVTSVLLEGGGEIHEAALRAAVVDKIHAFIAPKILGGQAAPGPVGGTGFRLHRAIRLTRIKADPLGEDWLITGYPVYPDDPGP